jgi:spore coat polysaccharide biosynthesis protein SpsF
MYNTEQEKFWANEFGTEYIERNLGEQLLASNLNFFSKALHQADKIESCIEFGANIGMNLKALKLLYPSIRLNAIEINENAANILRDFIGQDNVYVGSIFEHKVESKVQLSLIKGVLIHINPNMLQKVYEQLYNSSEKFILIAEYYNPTPVALNYRGYEDRLFKRDFAGEFLDKYRDTELIDYGFSYRRDPAFPQDDITWFLIKKK